MSTPNCINGDCSNNFVISEQNHTGTTTNSAVKISSFLIIFLVLIMIFKKLFYSVSSILLLCILFFVGWKFYNTMQEQFIPQSDIENYKTEFIYPPVQNSVLEKYPDIINFLFSVQDFYLYSPRNYELLISNLNDFFILYSDSELFPYTSGRNYTVAIKKKSDALNSLQNLIFSMPSSNNLTSKLNRSIDQLNYILSGYLKKIDNINSRFIAENGYNTDSVVLNIKDSLPKPANYYNDLINITNSGYGENLWTSEGFSTNVTAEVY